MGRPRHSAGTHQDVASGAGIVRVELSQWRGGSRAKAAALELMALYHLAKAAEILALYVTDGVVEGSYQIHNLLDMHFDRAASN